MTLEKLKKEWLDEGPVVLTLGTEQGGTVIAVEQEGPDHYNVVRFFSIGSDWHVSVDLRCGSASAVFETLNRAGGVLQ